MMVARSHKGNAKPTTLAGAISNSATSFAVATGGGTGYPDGSGGLFIVSLDVGTASEEKILCSARSADTFTVNSGGRGYDDTTAIGHVNNASVRHTFSAIEAEEANKHLTGATTHIDLTASPSVASGKGLVVKGLVSQAGNLQEWQTSTGTILGSFDGLSGILLANFLAAGAARIANTAISATASASGHTVIVVRGIGGQTGNLQEWQNSGGTLLTYIRAGGSMAVGSDNLGALGVGSAATALAKPVLQLTNTTVTASIAGGGILYCESGALKYRGELGTVTVLGAA